MRLITWNVASLKARIARTQAVLARHDPDVLCLQETKLPNAQFPQFAFPDHHFAAHGQATYNGVAILSKQPADEVRKGFAGDPCPEASRAIAARFGALWVYDLYVVNGKSPDDPAFDVKRRWLAALRDHVAAQHDPGEEVLLLGDFNITPSDADSWDPALLRSHIHHTDEERAWLAALRAWGLTDLHEAAGETAFTWWDYRDLAFPKGHGLRIDLALGTAPVASRLERVWVDRDERKQGTHVEKPSDHAPLVVDLR